MSLLDVSPALSQEVPGASDVLKDLVRMDTTNAPGDTRPVANYLKALFDAAGIENEIVVAPNGVAAHFIARLKGNGSKRPVLLAAHADVVPADRSRWSADPFAATEKDGFIYGRGTLDNKGDLAAYVTAVLRIAKDPAPRTRDIIFLAEADEEQGKYNTTWLATDHWDKMDAEFAINEGGRTTLGDDGKVREMDVTLADKLTLNLKLTTTGPTGHSSRPLPIDQTANGQLITALAKLQAYEPDVTLTPQTTAYLGTLADLRGGPEAIAIKHLLAAKNDSARTKAARAVIAADQGGWGVEGMLRNTLVITMINSGVKPNVIPGTAEATMNARLLPGQTVEDFIAGLNRVIGNPNAKLEIISTLPPSEIAGYYAARSNIKPSSTDTELYHALATASAETWPGVKVVPMLLTASTDATPWRLRGVPVYGIEPMPTDAGAAAGVHGDNERVGVAAENQGAEFAYRLLKAVTAP